MKLLKNLLLCTSIALLAACGSQEAANFDKNIDAAGVNIASAAPNNIATQATETTVVGTSPKRDLLANLAIAYPGGVLPAERAAAAAQQLAQNPAALKFNANSVTAATSANITSQAGTISPQSGGISPQAATSYTFGQYAPVQRAQNTTLFGSYFFSIYPSEMTNALAIQPTWNLEGAAFHASLGINPGLAPVWRFRNIINGSYLYTINDGEKSDIIANYSAYFVLEGPAWYASPVPVAGFSPLYRFRNLTNGTYLFSAYEAEKNAIVANYAGVFLLEGISYYVQQSAPLEMRVVAGSATPGGADGIGAAAEFFLVYGMAQQPSGNIYATNAYTNSIRQITPSGVVNTYAGLPGTPGYVDGSLAAARFEFPVGIVRDSAGYLFVSDYLSHTIRRIDATSVSTFAGVGNTPGSANTSIIFGTAAQFNGPAGMAIDAANNIYVADNGNHTVRKITPAGFVSTVAGLPGLPGLVNDTGFAARFKKPSGIAIDAAGNLFIADSGNNIIRKIAVGGAVTTVAGSSIGTAGNADGTGADARFNNPVGITIDAANNLYVADVFNRTVRKITPLGVVTTVVGINTAAPFAEGPLPSSLGDGTDASGGVSSVRVFGNQLYMGTPTRLLKVSGLP